MNAVAYYLLRLWIKTGLYLYYGKIKTVGIANIPKTGPVLFLPNHQGALMDVLLLVTHCRRKPFFLTRSDVFTNERLTGFFTFLRMLPVYRIRDGRGNLNKNQAVFNQCGHLFHNGEALVVFPEANHNLRRRVRPLSKGFTRIVFNALETNPGSDITLVPVGLNYNKNTGFPDRVSLYFGKSLNVKVLNHPSNQRTAAVQLKNLVSDRLKSLTTHIANENGYQETIDRLHTVGVDFLNPVETNAKLKAWEAEVNRKSDGQNHALTVQNINRGRKAKIGIGKNGSPLQSLFHNVLRTLFTVFNLPIIAFWRIFIKPKVWEREFTSTLRFGFALIAYPLYYLFVFMAVTAKFNALIAFLVLTILFVLNLVFVRLYDVRRP